MEPAAQRFVLQVRADAGACVLSYPELPELRLTPGRGWLELSLGDLVVDRIPPTRRHAAHAVVERWRNLIVRCWHCDGPLPSDWYKRWPGGPPAANRWPHVAPGAPGVMKLLQCPAFATVLTAVDPQVRAVWRRLHACHPLKLDLLGHEAPLESWFWKHPYLAADVLRIPGAAQVVRAMIETCADPDSERLWERLATGAWMDVCSPHGLPANRALRVTLAQCPLRLGLDGGAFLDLRGVELPRPRRTRREILAAVVVGRRHLGGGARPINGHLLLEAEDAALAGVEGEVVVEDLFDGAVEPYPLERTLIDLLDYPEACPDLPTLVRRSAQWHLLHGAEAMPDVDLFEDALAADTATAEPPFVLPPLPPSAQLTRLATVKAVRDEGRSMQHCVATYAQKAVEGRCFLYHLAIGTIVATLEFDAQGRLVQARGPRNGRNLATRFAEDRLAGPWPLRNASCAQSA